MDASFVRSALGEFQLHEVFDLHGSIRTRTMRVLFIFWGLLKKVSAPKVEIDI